MKRVFSLIGRPSPALAVSIVALALGLGKVAWAGVSASSSSSRVIHACVQSAGKGLAARELFLPVHGNACPKGEISLSWNQAGTPGPQGPRGETGLQGPESRNGNGSVGAEGPMGREGPEGRPGRPGEPGKEGPPGPTVSAFRSTPGATLSKATYTTVTQTTIELSATSVIDATASAYITGGSSAEEATCGLYLEGSELGLASHATVSGASDSMPISVVGSTLYEGFGERQPAAGPHTVELKCEQISGTGALKAVNPSVLAWASGEKE